jgi:hypothetical protein
MTGRFVILTVAGLFFAFTAASTRVYGLPQTSASQHEQHHATTPETPAAATPAGPQANMAAMMAADARLDELVAKMNAAKGDAKVDAIAELLTAVVQYHHMMRGSMMANMSSKMDTMKTPRKPGDER